MFTCSETLVGADGYIAFHMGLARQAGIGIGFEFLLFRVGPGREVLLT